MKSDTQTFKTTIGDKPLTMEVGHLAGQANGAVRAQLGDTVVLATAVMAAEPQSADYFPLHVEFDEKFYAVGRIKGSQWVKREGRPSDDAILTARLIDRTLRPLFPTYMRNEVQIIVSVLSFDEENDPDMLALVAASAALSISDIPWDGPISAVRASRTADGATTHINPTYDEREASALEVVVAGPEGVVNMLEGDGDEVAEDEMAAAIKSTDEDRANLIALQKEMVEKVGKAKTEVPLFKADEAVKKDLADMVQGELEDALFVADKTVRAKKLDELKEGALKKLAEKHPEHENIEKEGALLFEELAKKITQQNILENKRRIDGRALDELRSLGAEVGVLPRTHGSAIFSRGATQALSIVTLGAPGLEQSIETMEEVGKRRFMHHYNFPPFSVGETGRMFTGRREIGHGSLAERALSPVIPEKDAFPYVVRIVTEILSSNGSTSMAAVCGSSLSLMDAGVPLKGAVAGISVGLVSDESKNPGERYELLTDIQGTEDFYGHMDFKVAGTKDGVTAMQVDMKVRGITHEMIAAAFARARTARETILTTMNNALGSPREKLSRYAPRVLTITIDPKKIGDVIGPGGKIINRITDETGATIDIEDDGTIFITSPDQEGAEKARQWVDDITREVEPGEEFVGTVVRLMNFGAFVEVLPGQDGLVHVSELSDKYVKEVSDVVKEGDRVRVKVKEIDDEGRINLTMKGISQDDLGGKKST